LYASKGAGSRCGFAVAAYSGVVLSPKEFLQFQEEIHPTVRKVFQVLKRPGIGEESGGW